MPAAFRPLQQRVMNRVAPNSGYQYASAPDIELYPDGDQTSEDYI
jgi:AraC family transcriptional regulator